MMITHLMKDLDRARERLAQAYRDAEDHAEQIVIAEIVTHLVEAHVALLGLAASHPRSGTRPARSVPVDHGTPRAHRGPAVVGGV